MRLTRFLNSEPDEGASLADDASHPSEEQRSGSSSASDSSDSDYEESSDSSGMLPSNMDSHPLLMQAFPEIEASLDEVVPETRSQEHEEQLETVDPEQDVGEPIASASSTRSTRSVSTQGTSRDARRASNHPYRYSAGTFTYARTVLPRSNVRLVFQRPLPAALPTFQNIFRTPPSGVVSLFQPPANPYSNFHPRPRLPSRWPPRPIPSRCSHNRRDSASPRAAATQRRCIGLRLSTSEAPPGFRRRRQQRLRHRDRTRRAPAHAPPEVDIAPRVYARRVRFRKEPPSLGSRVQRADG